MPRTPTPRFRGPKDPAARAALERCLDRALDVFGGERLREEIEMDLVATNARCPLDFARLAGFSALDFAHDLVGIKGALDRTTGKLTGGFEPRCAKPSLRHVKPEGPRPPQRSLYGPPTAIEAGTSPPVAG